MPVLWNDLSRLQLDRLDIICPGAASYPLGEKIYVTGIEKVSELFNEGQKRELMTF